MDRHLGHAVRGGLAVAAACCSLLAAHAAPGGDAPEVTHDVKHDVSPALREIVARQGAGLGPRSPWTPPPLELPPLPESLAPAASAESVLQSTAGPLLAVTPGLNFEGSAGDGPSPPDANGAVGDTQYVQVVNYQYAVYDKASGARIFGPVAIDSLWAGFGTLCETINSGDPIVLWDKVAHRWFVSQVAFLVGGTSNYQCIAVSTTADAAGSFNRYAFDNGGDLPDYPKYAVWPDAYYGSSNDFALRVWRGAQACAYQRGAMINGRPATRVCFQQDTTVSGLVPADVDGPTPPPTGAPNTFVRLADTSTLGLYRFHVDFGTPANSTFTGPTNVPVASYAQACGGGACVPQLGTATQLDSLADRLMFRLAYRNFGDHDALVVTHSVVAGSGSGARWYEIRDPGGTPTLFQQGTFAPDATWRWMGSMALDRAGNMALGYSASSASLHPAIRYTGREASDPPGTMASENSVIEGGGSQTGTIRWGDYDSMNVDPQDDCTFWYTNEYYPLDGSGTWHTRIASFRFDSCVAATGTGNLRFTSPALPCAGAIGLRVADGNAGPGPLVAEAWSDTEQELESVTLAETAPGSHLYTGSITATTAPSVHGDGMLRVAAGDQVSAAYLDRSTATGDAVTTFATAVVDCAAAPPAAAEVTDITDTSAIVRWTTAEPTTGRVDWGPTAALGNTAEDTVLATAHALTLAPLNECARYYFRITAADAYGNQAVLDAGGQPFGFDAGRVPGFFRDGFETSTGWTLEGDWQIAAPQGKGTNDPDPAAAYAGMKVLGQDLTGLGARPGDYEKSTTYRATSPSLSAGGKTGVQLQIRRWLNYTGNSTASVEVRAGSGAWQTVWSGGGADGAKESSWRLTTYDLSPWVDGVPAFQVAFRLAASSNTVTASSWNVDSFVVREASQPQYDACGACQGAPSFLGARSAIDADPCAAGGGATVAWDAATAWGSGHAGSYAVYRDTVPNFTPSALNRIATGVTALTYTDVGAADGQTCYYLVRAENDETCSGGPRNGGMVDGNTAYRGVTPAASLPVPPAVTGLRVEQPVAADVRLTWSRVAGASVYRVFHSTSPLPGGFSQRIETGAAAANDAGAATDGQTWFYLVSAVNGCAQQGP